MSGGRSAESKKLCLAMEYAPHSYAFRLGPGNARKSAEAECPRKENYAVGGAREMLKGSEGPETLMQSTGNAVVPMDAGADTRLIASCGAAV
jgi:hypothetical protein